MCGRGRAQCVTLVRDHFHSQGLSFIAPRACSRLFCSHKILTPMFQRLLPRLRPYCTIRTGDPYAVLGVSRTSDAKEIRSRFLELARSHHPDNPGVDPSTAAQFKTISAAYHTLSDPERRATADLLLRDNSEAAAVAEAAVLASKAGRTGEGLKLFADQVLTMVAGTSPKAKISKAASEILSLAAQRGEPHHRPAKCVWEALLAWDAIDARACNGYFSLMLRSGHMADAMRAIRHAEAHGLEQSAHMASTARQVRRYKARQSSGD